MPPNEVTHADVVAAIAHLSEQILRLENRLSSLQERVDAVTDARVSKEAEAEYFR